MKLLGVKINNLTLVDALQKVEDLLLDSQQRYVVTPNPEFLVKAQKDEKFRDILNSADMSVPDGIGLIYASRFLGSPLKQRITGVDLMEKICQVAAQKGWQVFLYGAEPEPDVALETAAVLKNKYKQLNIEVLKSQGHTFSIAAKQILPTILFVALGSPKQEKWIAHYLKKMPQVDLAIGIGGSFDFISGRIKRAPVFVQNIGLEWFWRLFNQPWRISRIFNAVLVFPLMVLKERVWK